MLFSATLTVGSDLADPDLWNKDPAGYESRKFKSLRTFGANLHFNYSFLFVLPLLRMSSFLIYGPDLPKKPFMGRIYQ